MSLGQFLQFHQSRFRPESLRPKIELDQYQNWCDPMCHIKHDPINSANSWFILKFKEFTIFVAIINTSLGVFIFSPLQPNWIVALRTLKTIEFDKCDCEIVKYSYREKYFAKFWILSVAGGNAKRELSSNEHKNIFSQQEISHCAVMRESLDWLERNSPHFCMVHLK